MTLAAIVEEKELKTIKFKEKIMRCGNHEDTDGIVWQVNGVYHDNVYARRMDDILYELDKRRDIGFLDMELNYSNDALLNCVRPRNEFYRAEVI